MLKKVSNKVSKLYDKSFDIFKKCFRISDYPNNTQLQHYNNDYFDKKIIILTNDIINKDKHKDDTNLNPYIKMDIEPDTIIDEDEENKYIIDIHQDKKIYIEPEPKKKKEVVDTTNKNFILYYLDRIDITYNEILYHIQKYSVYKVLERNSNNIFNNDLKFFVTNENHIIFTNNILKIRTFWESNLIMCYTLKDIIIKIHKHKICVFATYNLALLYLERFFNNYGLIILDEQNFYIFFTISLLVANKYNEDSPYNNYSFSYITGIPLKMLNKLEVLFLNILKYDLNYNLNEFEKIKYIIH